MLACARIGAAHTSFSAASRPGAPRPRQGCQAKLVITADGGYRRGQIVPLKRNVDNALTECLTEHVSSSSRRTGDAASITMVEGRDHGRSRVIDGMRPIARPNRWTARTSSSSCTPRVHGKTQRHHPHDRRLHDGHYFTAKIRLRPPRRGHLLVYRRYGLGNGALYIVYGPLANGATTVMYEGRRTGTRIDSGRSSRSTASRSVTASDRDPGFMNRAGLAERHDLSTLRLLGTVGEPINPEAWMWYRTRSAGPLSGRGYLVADRDRHRS